MPRLDEENSSQLFLHLQSNSDVDPHSHTHMILLRVYRGTAHLML